MLLIITKLKFQNGFTLVETIITLLILGILITIGTGLIHTNTKTYVRVYNRSMMLADGRKAMRALRIDIQKLVPQNVTIMKNNQFAFKDLDGNAIEYKYENNVLKRNEEILARFLQQAPFDYLDADQNTTNKVSEIRFIRVKLNFKNQENSFQMEELIYARN